MLLRFFLVFVVCKCRVESSLYKEEDKDNTERKKYTKRKSKDNTERKNIQRVRVRITERQRDRDGQRGIVRKLEIEKGQREREENRVRKERYIKRKEK
jgi:hypothetical protein